MGFFEPLNRKKFNLNINMSKFLQRLMVVLAVVLLPLTMYAQQLPNAGFEDWNGEKFDGEIQPSSWYASNVEQLSFKFNFAHQEAGHSGKYSMMVQDQDVGAAGITETSPGYFSLGKPWVYLESITKISEATAGTAGAISWKYRPDSMVVWIKRTGSNTDKEDFYLLYYAWAGTAIGDKYKNKKGGCTSVSKTDEESDVRLELNGNECGTIQKVTQIAEGMWREKKTYGSWTRMAVPIYYFNNEIPNKMNIIFSASNYPNFRANSGLYAGNSLYVDDVEMVYSSKIQKLYIGGKEWKGFDPNSTDVQTYSLGESATAIPDITARRGVGSLTNARGKTVAFTGRDLTGSEMTIVKGDLESNPTTITVKSEDGKSTTVYKIQFQRAASSNATLAEVQINGESLASFRPGQTKYDIELPYGTTKAPVVTYTQAEDAQTVKVTQATSPTGTATIVVTAADKKTTKTYTFNFTVGELKDATLKDIKVNGTSLLGFTPSQTIYKVSLPVGTPTLSIEPVSAYPQGEQKIVISPSPLPTGNDINGSTIQITVTAGVQNPVTKVYKLNIKLEESSYSYLADLQVVGDEISYVNPAQLDNQQAIAFAPSLTTYYINLKMGSKKLPQITWKQGDEYQKVEMDALPEGVLDGTMRIIVTAGNGSDQTVYKLVFSTEKSENSTLNGIEIDGKPIEGFRPDSTYYVYELPIEATVLPEVKPIPHDEFQEIKTYAPSGLIGKYRISVMAGNGATTNYYIDFKQLKYSDNTLKNLSVEGYSLQDAEFNPIEFAPQRNEYWVKLSPDATEVPKVTIELQNAFYQDTVVRRPTSTNGDFKVTVRPRSGSSRIYTIHFVSKKSDNTALKMIYLNGDSLKAFDPATLSYVHVLDTGATELPVVTWDVAESTQTVTSVLEGRTIRLTVQAQNGAKRTYKIKFVIPSSASSQIDMIYLNEVPLPGFRKDSLEYTYELPYGSTCPKITVKSYPGQQVTITAPYAAGIATIRVATEEGDSQDYTIEFVSIPAATVQLLGILIDNVPIAGFSPTKMNYESSYEGDLPEVKAIPSATVDTVSVVWNDTVAWLHVKDVNGNKAAYSVAFTHILSSDHTLVGIYEDKGAGAQLISGFKAAQLNYSYSLAPGSTYPSLSYKVSGKAEVVFFGQLAEGKWGITVVAENGAEAVYTVQYTIEKYSDATLKDLVVTGQTISFNSNTFEYDLTIDEGEALPQLSVETREGQTVLISNVNDQQQQVIVYAENGSTNTYIINYARIKSSNALLSDILVGGVSIEGFDPSVTHYVDSLDRKDALGQPISVIPNVFPIGQLSNQTITTYFCRPDAVAKIHVEAQDGTTQDYFIDFPVRKSKNALLGDLYLDSEDVSISFNANTFEYEVTMPYTATACPIVIFEKAEPEQRIDYISRPLGQKSEIIVTAESGDQNTYSIQFNREVLETKNLLSKVRIVEKDTVLKFEDKAQRDFTISMPYGSRSFTIEYEKSYSEQTVFVQPGGVNAPTVVTVKANNGDVADEVYTFTPQVSTQNPAVLESISINGELFEDFDKNRFSYVVLSDATSTAAPIVLPKGLNGAVVTPTIVNHKHYQAIVSKDGFTNTYDLWFYYTKDVLPNPEFDQWEDAAYNGVKPVGWNTLGQFYDKYTWTLSTYTTGKEVTKEGTSVVKMETKYNSFPLGGFVPAYITLGTINAAFSVAAGSDFSVSGGITFRNTPDQLSVSFKQTSISNDMSRIVYQINGAMSSQEEVYTNTTTQSDFTTVNMDLRAKNAAAGVPQSMNIILNSFETEAGKNGLEASGAVMYVDWARFSFNHTLASLRVDTLDAAKDGNAFSVTLHDAERVEIPDLKFTGEVEDQVQEVTWNTPTKDADFEIRTATIRNYAENGTDYTDYTLEVKRPLDSISVLSDLLLDGATIAGFRGDSTDYIVHLPATTFRLKDLMPVASTSLQNITTSFADSTMTITVTPERGAATVYKVKFMTDLSDDTTLENITADGVTYEAETREYDIYTTNWPLITYAKRSDLQTVSMINGVLTVTAEDGSEGTYTIHRHEPIVHSNGVITEFSLGANVIVGFGGDEIEKNDPKPEEVVFFTCQIPSDSVVFIQDPAKMEWQVNGTDANTVYTWNYPSDKSANTNLAAILIGGVPYEDFIPGEYSYDLTSDTTVVLSFVEAMATQQVETTPSVVDGGVLYTTEVTAESGAKATYKVSVTRPLSNIATLDGILLDSVMVEGFDPAVKSYVVTLPAPKGAKLAQPKMPNVTYIVGQKGQKVTLEAGQLNTEKTVLTVESEDGNVTEFYELTINAEPSHYSDLTGITVNGEAMDHFEPGRHYYSVSLKTDEVEIGYTSDDRFQNVQTLIGVIKEGRQYRDTLHVTAEDGTFSDYVIEIYIENQSNDAQLANILLDNMDFMAYGLKSQINPDMKPFDPGNNEYHINVIKDSIPLVSAQLKMEGQSVKIETFKDSVYLHVWAVDSTLNTYKLYFEYKKSTNTALKWITINADSIIAPTENYYLYDKLNMGEDLPIIDAEPVSEMAVVTIDRSKNPITIFVTAEDDSYKATYTIDCDFKPSTVNTLEMIYLNGDSLKNFDPLKFTYDSVLNAGESFPTIDYGELIPHDANQWPYIDSMTVTFDSVEHIWVHQTTVKAQSNEMNVYTLSFTIRKWDIDTLESIEVENIPLPGFKGSELEYYYTFTPNQVTELAGRAPIIKWFKGEEHQLVDSAYVPDSYKGKCLGYKHVLTVRAENNATRTYTIHYPVELSSDATLQMINIDEVPLKDFDPERNNYKVELDFGLPVPNVTEITWNDDQKSKHYQMGDTVIIDVWAEDMTNNSYMVAFERVKSNIANLENIIIYDKAGKQFPYDRFEFATDSFDYVIVMPYDSTETEFIVPEMKIVKIDPFQTVTVDTIHKEDKDVIELNIHVLAPNGEDEKLYTLDFQFMRNNDAALTDLYFVHNYTDTVRFDFKSNKMDYAYKHPFGSDSSLFYLKEEIRFVLSDTLATAKVEEDEDGVFTVTVTAQDGTTQNVYSIVQSIAEDPENRLRMIVLDGDSLKGFSPDTTFYVYTLMNGAQAIPTDIEAIPMSENVQDISITRNPVGDTTLIFCTAQNGEDRVYKILFRASYINDGVPATENDVFIRRRGMQLFVSTIRRNVAFALFDRNGRLLYQSEVPTADPNSFEAAIDAWNKDILLDVDDKAYPNAGLWVDVNPNQIYFYTFSTANFKHKIKSGKMIITPFK